MIVKYCQFCGGELEVTGTCPKCSPAKENDAEMVNIPTDSPEKRPWYFSKRFKIIMFVLFPPLWTFFIFADKQSPKGAKYFAAALWVVILGSLWLTYSPDISATSDGTINFGTTVQGLKITDPKTDFAPNEKIKWATQLSKPLGTTSVSLTLARKQADGAEVLVGQRDLSVSTPDFNIISSDLDLPMFYFLTTIKPGLHILRIVAKDKVVAQGEFTITNKKAKTE